MTYIFSLSAISTWSFFPWLYFTTEYGSIYLAAVLPFPLVSCLVAFPTHAVPIFFHPWAGIY